MTASLRFLTALLSLWLFVFVTAFGQASPQSGELSLTLGEQRVKFAPTRSFQEMGLEVRNHAGEVVFTHLTSEAEFDWNLRTANNESLAPGLYRYALTLKFSEDLSRQYTGHFIVEKGQDQIWLTASDGAEVSGTALNAARSGGRSIAGLTSAEDKSVKRDVSGRELITEKGDEKGNKLTDKQKNARSEKASLLGTAGQLAKFAAGGVSVIDSVVTEDATGDIGIGTTTPDYKLDVEHGGGTGVRVKSTASFSVVDIDAFSGDAALRFARAGVNQWNIRNNPATDDLEIFELGGGGSRMRIQNTTGNVGIGTDNPQGKLHVFSTATNPFQVEVNGIGGLALTAQMDNYGPTGTFSGSGFLGRAAGGTKAAPTNVLPGDRLGFSVFGGYAGGAFRHTAAINGYVGTGTISATSLPTYLNFMTTPDGSIARLERLRIDQNGNVGIGTTAPTEKLHVIGNILATGTITPSDARYKQHIQTLSHALDKVQRLRGVSYDWRRDAYPQMGFSERPQLGFIAQELSQVLPEAVHQDAEGMYSVNYTSVVPVLVEAVKEQQAMMTQQQKTIAQQQRLMARLQKRLLKLEKTRKPAGR